jgi:hypothetical protein
MADNFPLTPGSGRNAATDEVTYSGDAADVQLIRPVLVTGSEGSKTVVDLPGDGTNGLDVDVTRVIPGTTATSLGKAEDAPHADGDTGVLMLGIRNHSGTGADGDYSGISVSSTGELQTLGRKDAKRIAVGVTGVTTSVTAYTAGDQVGTIISIADAVRAAGGTGLITSVLLIDQSDIIGAYDVVFFRETVTLAADNAAFAISDANSLKITQLVQLAGSFDLGANRIAQAYNLAVPYDCNGSTTLFAALIARVGHTFFTAGALPQLNVFVERN